jgi:hypothetical protein
MKYAGSIGLALALVIAGVASACGPATPPVEGPPSGTGEPTATAAPTTSVAPTTEPTATVAPTASTTPTATASVAPTAPPAPAGPPIMASKFAEDLKKAGFDLAKLPPKLDKMSDGQKKKIMPLFVKALGYADCKGCHVEGDFKKKTRNMHIAEHMYDDFVVAMRDEKGAATMFCDTCHQGSAKILNRTDLKAVGKYMDDQYVNHLARSDKKDHGCSTCHGDTMEMKIFDKMWQVNKGI